MIKYSYDHNKLADVCPINVHLDGKIAGKIIKVEGGFQYIPKWQREGGDIFKTKEEVKRSLED